MGRCESEERQIIQKAAQLKDLSFYLKAAKSQTRILIIWRRFVQFSTAAVCALVSVEKNGDELRASYRDVSERV